MVGDRSDIAGDRAASDRNRSNVSHNPHPPLGQDLALPSHYESIAELISEDDVAETVACGPDPDRHIEQISQYLEAGYEQVTVHQIGPDQAGFLSFYEDRVLPKVA